MKNTAIETSIQQAKDALCTADSSLQRIQIKTKLQQIAHSEVLNAYSLLDFKI